MVTLGLGRCADPHGCVGNACQPGFPDLLRTIAYRCFRCLRRCLNQPDQRNAAHHLRMFESEALHDDTAQRMPYEVNTFKTRAIDQLHDIGDKRFNGNRRLVATSTTAKVRDYDAKARR
jgi:hypothetical protein